MNVGYRDRYAIIGIGSTDLSKNSGRSVLTLATQASLAAISDAGMSLGDIDGIISTDYDSVVPSHLAHSLGLTDVGYWGTSGQAGSAPCAMIGHAIAAINSGMANNVLAYRALNGRSGARFGQSESASARYGGNGSYEEFFAPYGQLVPGQMWALVATRHMHQYGSTEKDLSAIAIACRNRANANPAAMMYEKPLTLDSYLESRMLTEPLRLNDYSLDTDGACAVIVTSLDRALDGPHRPAMIRAVAQATSHGAQGGSFYAALARSSLTEHPSRRVAQSLYKIAGMGPSDIDVAQIYDCFTISAMIQLEDYGFCGVGEGGALASSGALELGAAIPINTAGGNLSEGYVHGMTHVLEGVRQIRGTSTSQVVGAETCLVTSAIPTPTSALILRSAA